MTDVSSTIIVGEWTITPLDGSLRFDFQGVTDMWLSIKTARDLAQALQAWIERNAKVEA